MLFFHNSYGTLEFPDCGNLVGADCMGNLRWANTETSQTWNLSKAPQTCLCKIILVWVKCLVIFFAIRSCLCTNTGGKGLNRSRAKKNITHFFIKQHNMFERMNRSCDNFQQQFTNSREVNHNFSLNHNFISALEIHTHLSYIHIEKLKEELLRMFNRTGVAEAVLQTPLLLIN